MDKIIDSINNLIINTSGGILALWVVTSYFFVRFLKYCGRKIAEGANNDLILKLLPNLEIKMNEKLEIMNEKIEEISQGLESYRLSKHNIDTENKYLREVILANDIELLEEIRIVLKKHEKK